MRARIAKKDILSAIMRTVSIADKKSVVPILSHVLLEFNDSQLCLKATDLDHSIIEIVPAMVDTFGAVAVPASTLGDIVKKVPDNAMMEFSLADKGSKILITAGKSKFEISTLNASDFPAIVPLKDGCNINIKSVDLNKLISRTKFSMSPEESRHNLNGIYFHKEDGKLKAASTDGHRLSTSQISIDTPEEIHGSILSKKTVFEIKKLLDTHSGDVCFTFSANKVQFYFGDAIFISKLVDGTFPDYKRVIPETSTNFFTIKRTDFAEIVDRVAVISDDKVRSVRLELSKNTLVFKVANSKIGSGTDETDVFYSGQNWSAGFNANYLLDVAQTLSGETLKIFIKESLSPILIVDESEPDSMFVVMPMRI